MTWTAITPPSWPNWPIAAPLICWLTSARCVRTRSRSVAGLADDDLARRGRHPALGEDAALADFIRIVFMHGKLHLRDLSRALGRVTRNTQIGP